MSGYKLMKRLKEVRNQFRLTVTQQAIYCELITICNEKHWPAEFEVSNDTICANLNLCERQLQRGRKKLIEAGLISYHSGDGRHNKGKYSFTDKRATNQTPFNSEKGDRKGDKSDPLSGVERATYCHPLEAERATNQTPFLSPFRGDNRGENLKTFNSTKEKENKEKDFEQEADADLLEKKIEATAKEILSPLPTETDIPKEKNSAKKEKVAITHPFQKWLIEKCPRVMKLDQPITPEEAQKIADNHTGEFVKKIFLAMENYKPLNKNYISAYKTFCVWAEREKQRPEPKSDRPYKDFSKIPTPL